MTHMHEEGSTRNPGSRDLYAPRGKHKPTYSCTSRGINLLPRGIHMFGALVRVPHASRLASSSATRASAPEERTARSDRSRIRDLFSKWSRCSDT